MAQVTRDDLRGEMWLVFSGVHDPTRKNSLEVGGRKQRKKGFYSITASYLLDVTI